ncbi:MAG: hypothetical protein JF607_24485 [Burkholderiales bacterium]|nr:hypothetical protein [Burkholderiales bacterium]MBW8893052.1 hypothetical protein [Burkholderiales bacterium]
MALMDRYRGSHEDFDHYVVPAVAAIKQQKDTIATLVELARMGMPAQKLRLVFNMLDEATSVAEAFRPLLAFLQEQPLACADTAFRLGSNEVYESQRGMPHTAPSYSRRAVAFLRFARDSPDRPFLEDRG